MVPTRQFCFAKASRLHFLKILKWCSLSTDDLLYFYNSAVRPVLEYACPAWHTSLTTEQSSQIELIQKRAFRIIFSSNCLDYENFCYIHNLDTLEARRTELCRSFLTSNVLNENSCLHSTLPVITASSGCSLFISVPEKIWTGYDMHL